MSSCSDSTGAAVPDIDRILAVLDSAFAADSLPVEDIHVGAAAQPALVSADGDSLLESSAAAPVEWQADDALSSTHIFEVMKQEEDAAALMQALKADGASGASVAH